MISVNCNSQRIDSSSFFVNKGLYKINIRKTVNDNQTTWLAGVRKTTLAGPPKKMARKPPKN